MCAPSHHMHPTGPSPEREGGKKMKADQKIINLLCLRDTRFLSVSNPCDKADVHLVH